MSNPKTKKQVHDRIEIKIHIKDLKSKFKKLCKENNTTMTEVLENEIIKYVQNKG